MSTTSETLVALRGVFRRAIATDAGEIRTLKAATRAEQRAGSPEAPKLQSRLARLRHAARARHLAYSLWKGRTWAQIENNHPDGDPNLTVGVAKAWLEAAEAAGAPALPPSLGVHIARWLS